LFLFLVYQVSYMQLVAAPVSITIFVGGARPIRAVIVMGGGVVGLGTLACCISCGKVTLSLALSSFPVCRFRHSCPHLLVPASLWRFLTVFGCFGCCFDFGLVPCSVLDFGFCFGRGLCPGGPNRHCFRALAYCSMNIL
jgi:hypothetical protein